MLDIDRIYQGDCLQVMKDIEDKSIDLIIADPPCELPPHKCVGFLLQRRAKLDEIKLNSPLHKRYLISFKLSLINRFGLSQPYQMSGY